MNTWVTLTDTFSRLAGRAGNLNRRIACVRGGASRCFMAVVGPGLITSNVDNDAGGIARLHHRRRAVWLRAALVADSDDHCSLCERRNVRAHGRGDG